jgi:hypothetical protein
MSALNANNQTNQIRLMVSGMKSNGISIPQTLTDEIALLDSLRTVKAKQDAYRLSAMNDLANVPADQFEEALSKAQSLWSENDPIDQFAERVEAVHYQRIISALYNASGDLMADIQGKINGIVEAYRLNDVQLPQELATYNIMQSTPQDLEAINAYRQAVPSLNALWGNYKSIGTHLGHDLAAREFSSAMDVAFLISDVDTFPAARDLANKFEILRLGTVSMKNISQLGVWGLVNLEGHRIDMRSIDEAQFRRGQVQFSATPVTQADGNKAVILR